jgi:hypothetical protein
MKKEMGNLGAIRTRTALTRCDQEGEYADKGISDIILQLFLCITLGWLPSNVGIIKGVTWGSRGLLGLLDLILEMHGNKSWEC